MSSRTHPPHRHCSNLAWVLWEIEGYEKREVNEKWNIKLEHNYSAHTVLSCWLKERERWWKTCICCVIDAGVLPDHLSSTRAPLTNINQHENSQLHPWQRSSFKQWNWRTKSNKTTWIRSTLYFWYTMIPESIWTLKKHLKKLISFIYIYVICRIFEQYIIEKSFVQINEIIF